MQPMCPTARHTGGLGEVQRYATTPVTESGLVRLLLNPNVVGEKIAVQQALASCSR